MANFTRVKPLGWALKEKLTSAQQNQLDIDHAKAVNGDDGSVHDGDVTLGSLTTARDVVAQSAVKGPMVLGDKVSPRGVGTQTVDCVAGGAVTVDLTSYDTHIITLTNSGGTSCRLASLALTTTTADADREIKPGSRYRVFFDTNEPDGAEIDVAMSWPSTMKFTADSDRYLMLEGGGDVACIELEQVGTAGAPVFLVQTTRRRSA